MHHNNSFKSTMTKNKMSFFDPCEDPYHDPNFSTSCDFPENYKLTSEREDPEFRLAQAIWNLPPKQRDYEILIKLNMSKRDFLRRQSRRFPWILIGPMGFGGWDSEVGGDAVLFDTKRHFLNKVYQMHGLTPEQIRMHGPCLDVLQKITQISSVSPRYILDEDPPSIGYVSPEEVRARVTTGFHRTVLDARMTMEWIALSMYDIVNQLRDKKTKKLHSPQSSSRELQRGNNSRDLSFQPRLFWNERVEYGEDGLGFKRTPTYYAWGQGHQQKVLVPPRRLVS